MLNLFNDNKTSHLTILLQFKTHREYIFGYCSIFMILFWHYENFHIHLSPILHSNKQHNNLLMKKIYSLLVCACVATLMSSATAQFKLAERPECSRQALKMTKAPSRSKASTTWTDWTSAGTCTLTVSDDFADFTGMDEYSGIFTGKTVDTRHAVDNESQVQYRFNGIFNDASIVVDLDLATNSIKLMPQSTNITDLFFEQLLTVADFATCYETISSPEDLGMSEEEFQVVVDTYAAYNYYIPELQRFYIFTGYYHEGESDVVAIADLSIQMDGAVNYIPEIKPVSLFSNETHPQQASITFPDETSYVEYLVQPGHYTEAKLQELIDNGGTQLDKSGIVDITAPAVGLNTIIAITHGIISGQPLELSHAEFTYSPDEDQQWKSLGETDVTSDILQLISETQPFDYQVQIQQSLTNESLYRLVNPHGTTYPENNSADDYDSSVNHYLIFDVSDPEYVKLTPAHVEKIYAAPVYVLGTAQMLTEAGKEEDFVKTYKGTYANGYISFPTDGLSLGCNAWNLIQNDLAPEGFYFTNPSGTFKIKVPDAGSVSNINSDDYIIPEYFSLQGIRLSSPTPGSIAIKRCGSKVEKIYVR